MPFQRSYAAGGGGGAGSGTVTSVTATNASVTVSGDTAVSPTIGLPLSAATPLAPGTAAAGTSTTKSNDDHRHAPLWRCSIGQWWVGNLAANATAAFRFASNSSATTAFFCPYAGTITAIDARGDANITAGSTSAVFQVTINGVAQTDANSVLTCVANANGGYQVLTTPVAVAAGDLVGVRAVTDGSWTATAWDPTVNVWFSGTT